MCEGESEKKNIFMKHVKILLIIIISKQYSREGWKKKRKSGKVKLNYCKR